MSDRRILFAKIALEKGFISLDQFHEGLDFLEANPHQPGEEFFLRQGYITSRQVKHLKEVLASQQQKDRLGEYQLLEKLGEGGMGEVYRALHQPTSEVRALKIIYSELVSDFEFVQRFFRESRTAVKLRHPNIVRTYEGEKIGERYFLAMEYIEGEDLDYYVRRKGRLGLAESLEIVKKIARALEEADKHGVVHRDIKPENIMLTSSKEPKLMDFGLAKVSDNLDLTQTGYVVGTPSFVAPEQALGKKKIDIRADIYSLGVTLFYMLTGQVPFEGESPAVVFHKQINDPFPKIQKFRPDIPSPVVSLLNRMTAKKPFQRPKNPSELMEMIEAVEEGKKLRKTNYHLRTTRIGRMVEEGKKKTWALSLVAFLFLLSLGSVFYFLFSEEGKKKVVEKEDRRDSPSSTDQKNKILQWWEKGSPFARSLKKALEPYEKGEWEKAVDSWKKGEVEKKRLYGDFLAFFELSRAFGKPGTCLADGFLAKNLSKKQSLISLKARLFNLKNRLPPSLLSLSEDMEVLTQIYNCEDLRRQGKIKEALQQAELIQKRGAKSHYFSLTAKIQRCRWKAYRCYLQFEIFFGLSPRSSSARVLEKRHDFLRQVWACLKESSQRPDLFSPREETSLDELYTGIARGLGAILKEGENMKNPRLSNFLIFLLYREILMALLQMRGFREMARAIKVGKEDFKIRTPQGLEKVYKDYWCLRQIIWAQGFFSRLGQIKVENRREKEAFYRQIFLNQIVFSQLRHRIVEEEDRVLFYHLFSFPRQSIQSWIRPLKYLKNHLNSDHKYGFVLQFGFPDRMLGWIFNRGNLVVRPDPVFPSQKTLKAPETGWKTPLIKVTPGGLKREIHFLRFKEGSEFIFIINQKLGVRISRERKIMTFRIWIGENCSPKTVLQGDFPDETEKVKIIKGDRPALVMEFGPRQFALGLSSWKVAWARRHQIKTFTFQRKAEVISRIDLPEKTQNPRQQISHYYFRHLDLGKYMSHYTFRPRNLKILIDDSIDAFEKLYK